MYIWCEDRGLGSKIKHKHTRFFQGTVGCGVVLHSECPSYDVRLCYRNTIFDHWDFSLF